MPSFSRRRAIDWWKGGRCVMVGYVRWEEKRKRLTLRRCPLGDGEVCLLEGGGRLDRRVQRRVRQAAQAMADAGVRYAAAPPEWAALLLPLGSRPRWRAAGHAGAAGGLRLQALGLCRSQASVVRASPARRGRYGGGGSAGSAGKVSVAATGPGGRRRGDPYGTGTDWERAVRWRSWRYASAQRRRGFPPC